MSKYKHAMEMLSAINSGQETEWKRMTGEWLPDKEPQNTCLDILNDPKRYRVKETPSKVSFGPEDIRPGMVFRIVKTTVTSWRYPECVENGGVLIFGAWHGWASLMHNFEWSTDAITWHPCEKPSQPPPKREPRRVFVNYYIGAEQIGVMHLSKEGAEAGANDKACEVAVEFVEVVR